MGPEEEQAHCKLDLIVQESNLVVIKQGISILFPADRNRKSTYEISYKTKKLSKE